jgi:ATP-binding protein involved in chromosome partitioning
MEGKRVGILDADIHGPSVPRLLGLEGKEVKASPVGAFPIEGLLGMKIMSIDFFLNEASPAIWRGPLKMRAIKQFLTEVVWGELDYLFIDLPPGTGDEPLSIAQLLPEMDGVVIVTMPSQLSSSIVKKAVTFAEHLNMQTIGVVENMSGFICPTAAKRQRFLVRAAAKKCLRKSVYHFLAASRLIPRLPLTPIRGRRLCTPIRTLRQLRRLWLL